jgi:hypothetical protein
LSSEKEHSVRTVSLTLLAALAIASVTAAQVALPRAPGAGSQPAPVSIASQPDPVINAVVSAVMPRVPGRGQVKGAPFSATQTTTHEQTLSDGTLIKSTVEVQLWRDAEGRMRAEGKLKSSSPQQGRVVSVWNPTDGTAISWISGNPSTSFATVIHLPESQLNGMVRSLAAAPPPQPGAFARTQQPSAAAAPDSANIHTESLPQDNIAGLDVTGTRTTQVIPAGTADNDRDITVVSETWTSPDLSYTVLQTSSDPRSGKITTELTNIDRSEPDPALFKVPEGYKGTSIPQPPVPGSPR